MVETDPAARWARILTDEQWAKVERNSGLPPDARPKIGMAIAEYRNRFAIKDAQKNPTETRIVGRLPIL
jgi:hypothetical protein